MNIEYVYGVHCGDENCYACGTQRYNCEEPQLSYFSILSSIFL